MEQHSRNATSFEIVGKQRPSGLLHWILIGVVSVVIAIGVTGAYWYHFDRLASYAPSECAVYVHATSRFWKHIPDKTNTVLKTNATALGLSTSQWDALASLRKPTAFCYTSHGKPLWFMRTSQKVSTTLANAGVVGQVSSDNKVLFFPTTSVGYWAPTVSMTMAPRPWLNFSTIDAYINTEKLLLKPEAIQEYLPTVSTWLVAKQSLGGWKITSRTPIQDPASVTAVPRPILANATMIAQNISLPRVGVPGSPTQVNFLFSLLTEIHGSVDLVQFPDDRFVLEVPTATMSTISLQQAVAQVLGRMLPTPKEKMLPDGTKATHLVADPSVFPFTETTGTTEKLSIPNLNQVVYTIRENGKTIVLNNLTQQEYLDYTHQAIVFDKTTNLNDCQKQSYSWIVIPLSTHKSLQPYSQALLGTTKPGKLLICID